MRSIIKYAKNYFNFSNKQIYLGRWRLKHSEECLDKFTKQIPDPGYQNANKEIIFVYEYKKIYSNTI